MSITSQTVCIRYQCDDYRFTDRYTLHKNVQLLSKIANIITQYRLKYFIGYAHKMHRIPVFYILSN